MPRSAAKPSNKSATWEEEAFIARLVTDPAKPPRARVLPAFLGRSSKKGCVRLYLHPNLTPFLEIPRVEILHIQPIPVQHSPLGGSFVWVSEAGLRASTGAPGGGADPNKSNDQREIKRWPSWGDEHPMGPEVSLSASTLWSYLYGEVTPVSSPRAEERLTKVAWGEGAPPTLWVGEHGGSWGPGSGNPFGGF